MPELGPYGSVRGARGNSRPYRESQISGPSSPFLTHFGLGGGAPPHRILRKNARCDWISPLNREIDK